MTAASQIEFNQMHYYQQVPKLWAPTLRRFNYLLKSYVLFSCFFLVLAGIELAAFISFFALLSKSTVIAFTLAVFSHNFFLFCAPTLSFS